MRWCGWSSEARGAFLLAVGVLFFAGMDAAIKVLAQARPALEVVALRYAINLALGCALFMPKAGLSAFGVNRPWMALARGASLAGSSLCMALALSKLPLAETTAVGFAAPLAAALLSGPILGERVAPAALGAGALGFLGVLVVARPGGGLSGEGLVWAGLAAAGNVAYQLLSRRLGPSERSSSLLLWVAATGAFGYGAALPWAWSGQAVSWAEAGLFLWVGFAGLAGHWLLTRAYSMAPAWKLSPILYLQLAWAGVFGWLAFGRVPDALGLCGMALVCAAGVLSVRGAGRGGKIQGSSA